MGHSSTCNSIATSLSFGLSASPADTSHALAFGINTASVAPQALGTTINAASYVFLTAGALSLSSSATAITLTASSGKYIITTATTTVTMPVVSTLQVGFRFWIYNNKGSTGNATVNSSGGNLMLQIPNHNYGFFMCISTSGTTAASWASSAAFAWT